MNCDEAAEKVIDILNTDFAILRTVKGYQLKYYPASRGYSLLACC